MPTASIDARATCERTALRRDGPWTRGLAHLRWSVTILNLLVLAIWLASGWMAVWARTSTVFLNLGEGIVRLDSLGPYHRPAPQDIGVRWFWGGPRNIRSLFSQRALPVFRWTGPYSWGSWGTVSRVIPLWLVQALCGVPAILLWAVWWRTRRRYAAGRCQACGYNLTGNVSGRCPECGAATGAQAQGQAG